jgi:EAL domain-containing protein (putative c-di-GMP-specific phosphodiesterase class I)
VGTETGDPVLARAIIALGKTLRLETVAEGIEHAVQCGELLALGCKYGQGYHFGRPVPMEELGRPVAGEAVGRG